MTRPFTRGDAKRRARSSRHGAETWAGAVIERERFVGEYVGEDAVAARRFVAIARREVEHQLAQAEAYERIARGEEPYR